MLLNLDGSVTMQCGETEIGQGADTAYAQMTSDVVGLGDYRKVHVVSCAGYRYHAYGLGRLRLPPDVCGRLLPSARRA